jgi:hypothetical protein
MYSTYCTIYCVARLAVFHHQCFISNLSNYEISVENTEFSSLKGDPNEPADISSSRTIARNRSSK